MSLHGQVNTYQCRWSVNEMGLWEDDQRMISWWWLIIVSMMVGSFSFIMCAVLVASKGKEEWESDVTWTNSNASLRDVYINGSRHERRRVWRDYWKVINRR